jgi:hypothetical protein
MVSVWASDMVSFSVIVWTRDMARIRAMAITSIRNRLVLGLGLELGFG